MVSVERQCSQPDATKAVPPPSDFIAPATVSSEVGRPIHSGSHEGLHASTRIYQRIYPSPHKGTDVPAGIIVSTGMAIGIGIGIGIGICICAKGGGGGGQAADGGAGAGPGAGARVRA